MVGNHRLDFTPFQSSDPLLLESELNEDARIVRQAAPEFAKELRPRIERAYLDETTDLKLFRLGL